MEVLNALGWVLLFYAIDYSKVQTPFFLCFCSVLKAVLLLLKAEAIGKVRLAGHISKTEHFKLFNFF